MVTTIVSVANADDVFTKLADMMALAPNATRLIDPKDDPKPAELKQKEIDHQFRIEVGPPQASLLVWILDPRDKAGQAIPPQATVFMLHGIMSRMNGMLSQAKKFRREGCRVVLVDSRGHGRSTGQYLTYGVQESKDLSQVLDFLAEKGLIAGNVGVFGMSYGAGTAIEWAGQEPRVQSVVTYASFSSLRKVAMNYARKYLPGSKYYLTYAHAQNVIDATAQKAGFDPDDASPARAIAQTQADVLLIHGTKDEFIPFIHAKRLKKASNGKKNCKLVLMVGKIEKGARWMGFRALKRGPLFN